LATLGEWLIPNEELTLSANALASSGRFGRTIHAGRWHGDVVVHGFNMAAPFLQCVRDLTLIRHENLVLYMGACVDQHEKGPYRIVTNPVKGISLHDKLQKRRAELKVSDSGRERAIKAEKYFGNVKNVIRHFESGYGKVICTLSFQANTGPCMPCSSLEPALASIAKQLSNALGYLHARGVVHARVSGKNVFLERKHVQLSLLDYDVDATNVVYSSPQVLSHSKAPYAGKEASDDVFAFGKSLNYRLRKLFHPEIFDCRNDSLRTLFLQAAFGRRERRNGRG